VPRGESGVALLEAIVALTILGIAGTSAVVMASESARTVRRAREADAEVREASAFLDAVSLWSREDLDRHLGSRAEGPWRLRVDRPTQTLYTVALTDSAGGPELLRTALFRPDTARAQP
jgi:type II secretory pathway pseudopilin PulG